MTTGAEGIALIKRWEACLLNPYLDGGEVATIGWGNTYYEDGRKVKLTDPPVTQDRADKLFRNILTEVEHEVSNMLMQSLKQNQFDALMCFAWNVGGPRLKRSTLLRMINTNPEDPGIHEQFMRWHKDNGKRVIGLMKRRKEEAELYFKKNEA